MFVHPVFDPIVFSVGPLAVRWYGLMYVVGFALVWWFGRLRIKANPTGTWQQQHLDAHLQQRRRGHSGWAGHTNMPIRRGR